MAARAVARRFRLPETHTHVQTGPAPLALAVYGAVALVSLAIAYARGTNPVALPTGSDEAWLPLPAWAVDVVSLAGGVVLGVATVRATRVFVRRSAWARALHADLRPAVRHTGNRGLFVLGIASAVAEELFFRGLLTPAIGLVLSSLLFGALHRLRGRAGWIWATWAGLMGLLFGSLFLATGSLLGPIVAHAAINVLNLRFLRDTDVEPRAPRRLGGLL